MIFPVRSSSNAKTLLTKTWAIPPAIGSTTPNAVSGTTLSATTTTSTTTLGLTTNGTPSNPAISWSSAPNMGIRRTGTDSLAIVTAGADHLTINSTEVSTDLPAHFTSTVLVDGISTLDGGLKVDTNGVQINKIFMHTETLSFTATANTTTDTAFTATGVAVDNAVIVMDPTAGAPAGVVSTAWASATNQITLRTINATGSGITFTSVVFWFVIMQFQSGGGGGFE